MAYNKVVYGTTVLVDLTADTVAPDKMDAGITAHDKAGNQIIGTRVANTIRIGTPDDSIGIDGDIFVEI